MRIAIVGGGCSGVLVALHLLRSGFRDSLTIVEPRAVLGQGLAFSTTFDGHLLNVPARKMSALADEPSHFLDWLRARDFPGAEPGVFAPRVLYGKYLGELLRDQLASNGENFRHVQAEVAGIVRQGDGLRLLLGDGSSLEADRVVLALGNPPSGSHAAPPPKGMEDRWHSSPWLEGVLKLRAPGERILILGAGQTAVDAVLALQSQPGGCVIHMLSRSGQLPRVHTTDPATTEPLPIAPGDGIRAILHALRAQVRREQPSGVPWQAVVDALRPVSDRVWQNLPLVERRRFLRHLKTWWEIHRSRMPPSIGAQLDRYRAEGRVEVLAGRMRTCSATSAGMDVEVALRGNGQCHIRVDRVIDCTGIHEYYHVHPRPLIRDLLRQGLASANDLGIGFHTDEHGGLAGPASHLLFTLGPPRRGELFEVIAIPEIRVQAEALAAHLLSGGRQIEP